MSKSAASAPAGLNVSLPSVRRIHSLIKEKSDVQVKLITGDVLQGRILWVDDNCLGLESAEGKVLLWQHAIALIR
ncbi:MAG: Hfq-related RNA-binding protein [Pseudanabaenaceae cyanobacterium]|jgi:host factor-I protein